MSETKQDGPWKLACGVCHFEAEDVAAFVDHCMVTGHVFPPGLLGAEDNSVEQLTQMLMQLQMDPEHPPDGVEARPIDLEEELADPDVPEEAKAAIRGFMAERQRAVGCDRCSRGVPGKGQWIHGRLLCAECHAEWLAWRRTHVGVGDDDGA